MAERMTNGIVQAGRAVSASSLEVRTNSELENEAGEGPSIRKTESGPLHPEHCTYHVQHHCRCGSFRWQELHPAWEKFCTCNLYNLQNPEKPSDFKGGMESGILSDFQKQESIERASHLSISPPCSTNPFNTHSSCSIGSTTQNRCHEEPDIHYHKNIKRRNTSYDASFRETWRNLYTAECIVFIAAACLFIIVPCLCFALMRTVSLGDDRKSRLIFLIGVLVEIACAGIAVLIVKKNLPVLLHTIIAVLVFSIWLGSFLDLLSSSPSPS